MNDLRKAAEALLNHWEAGEYKNCTGDMAGHIRVLREAAAQPEWVEELRGNTPDCKTHPDAPHGFDRNASHSADRYVCECEGWEPPKREWVCCVCGDPKALGIVHSADAPCFHYTKREWVGLTKEDFYKKDDETVFVLGMKFAEARLKEKNT
jgi:hypothetical protein